MRRYALIKGKFTRSIPQHLPGNYRVLLEQGDQTVIEGEDDADFTLDDYVLPVLARSLNFGEEIDRNHPILQALPATAAQLQIGDCIFEVTTLLDPKGPKVGLVGKNCKIVAGTRQLDSITVRLTKTAEG